MQMETGSKGNCFDTLSHSAVSELRTLVSVLGWSEILDVHFWQASAGSSVGRLNQRARATP